MAQLGSELSNVRIIGIAVLLFCSVLLGVGIHHLIATGTCSSTGYAADYGPVPKCPSGTGWWLAFLFAGIIGGLIGAFMATSLGLVFAGIFGAIGLGSLSIVLDSHASNGSKLFGAIFGACFALVGIISGIAVVSSALRSLRRPPRRTDRTAVPAGGGPSGTTPSASASGTAQAAAAFGTQAASAFGTPQATAAFGSSAQDADPILSAYHASQTGSTPSPPPARIPAPPAPARSVATSAPGLTPLNLLPGLQAAKQSVTGDALDDLSKLADLHAKGALTDAEFAQAKAKLLGEM